MIPNFFKKKVSSDFSGSRRLSGKESRGVQMELFSFCLLSVGGVLRELRCVHEVYVIPL